MSAFYPLMMLFSSFYFSIQEFQLKSPVYARLPIPRIFPDVSRRAKLVFISVNDPVPYFTPTPNRKQASLALLGSGYHLGVFCLDNSGRLGFFVAFFGFFPHVNFMQSRPRERLPCLFVFIAFGEICERILYGIEIVQTNDFVISLLVGLIRHSPIILRK